MYQRGHGVRGPRRPLRTAPPRETLRRMFARPVAVGHPSGSVYIRRRGIPRRENCSLILTLDVPYTGGLSEELDTLDQVLRTPSLPIISRQGRDSNLR